MFIYGNRWNTHINKLSFKIPDLQCHSTTRSSSSAIQADAHDILNDSLQLLPHRVPGHLRQPVVSQSRYPTPKQIKFITANGQGWRAETSGPAAKPALGGPQKPTSSREVLDTCVVRDFISELTTSCVVPGGRGDDFGQASMKTVMNSGN